MSNFAAFMVMANLLPGGVLQVGYVLHNGYRHARGLYYLNQEFVRLIEWTRLPGDEIAPGSDVIGEYLQDDSIELIHRMPPLL
jgi:nitric oxide reductase large subunit